MSKAAGQERWGVYFSGRVQGVGFRYTTRSLAGRFAVTGWVRNLPDGRVELAAEGPADEVGRFVEAVKREMNAYIDQVQIKRQPASGEFQRFRIVP